jgi:hypothetical protein
VALRDGGWQPQDMRAYGFPIGYALEAARNQVASRRVKGETMAERTAASGRWLQPPPSLRYVTWAAAAPFRLLGRPFEHSSRGTGLVALASRA